ncbi:copper resistance CopC family protein [Alkalicaulis satelles]|nr:copper resistance CopC family protein [Alkalicaulis satelles]
MPLIRLAAAAAIAMVMAGAAFAHTVMTHSNIRDGDVLAQAPSSFDFGFADPVALAGLELAEVDGDAIDIGFQRERGMQAEFSVALPSLEDGHYVLNWRAVAQDGHVMRGAISFHIDEDAPAGHEHEPESAGEHGHHHHHHDHGDEGATPGHDDHGHGAHEDLVGLIESTPADGAIVDSGLERIELRFDHPMTVRSIQLSTLAMERIRVEFEASDEPVMSVEAHMEPLDPGEYELSWRADGGDHEMSGLIRFTVQ